MDRTADELACLLKRMDEYSGKWYVSKGFRLLDSIGSCLLFFLRKRDMFSELVAQKYDYLTPEQYSIQNPHDIQDVAKSSSYKMEAL